MFEINVSPRKTDLRLKLHYQTHHERLTLARYKWTSDSVKFFYFSS